MSNINEYNTREARRINNLPDSELGEGGPFLEFDYPDGLDYDGNPITDMGYDGRMIYIEYDTPDGPFEFDSLRFQTEMNNGTIIVTGYSPGLMSAEDVYEDYPDAPHAETLRPLYDALRAVGVQFEYTLTKA